MQKYVLDRPVTIAGPDFWGRAAQVVLEPTDEPGWFWRVEGKDILLKPHLLRRYERHLALAHNGNCLHVFEHLGALRFTGLDHVRIISKTPWLPYDGRAKQFWDLVRESMHPMGKLIPWRIPRKIRPTEGADACVSYKPNGEDALRLTVCISYKGVGSLEVLATTSYNDFERYAYARTPGWPSWTRYAGKAASFVGWPHLGNVVWPDPNNRVATLYEFAEHRALDIWGALSVLCPPGGVLTGDFLSVCAGHRHDAIFVHDAPPLVCTKMREMITA